MANETSRRIIELIRQVPAGRVSTYGTIASLAGLANGARQVVRILHASNEAKPWQRILRKDGSIALPEGAGFEEQKALLEAEGVEVSAAGRVDLVRYGWPEGSFGGELAAKAIKAAGGHGNPKPGSPGRPAARRGQGRSGERR